METSPCKGKSADTESFFPFRAHIPLHLSSGRCPGLSAWWPFRPLIYCCSITSETLVKKQKSRVKSPKTSMKCRAVSLMNLRASAYQSTCIGSWIYVHPFMNLRALAYARSFIRCTHPPKLNQIKFCWRKNYPIIPILSDKMRNVSEWSDSFCVNLF